jgi:hypothetical protein
MLLWLLLVALFAVYVVACFPVVRHGLACALGFHAYRRGVARVGYGWPAVPSLRWSWRCTHCGVGLTPPLPPLLTRLA